MASTQCLVEKCFNKGVHRFPVDETRKQMWLSALNCPTDCVMTCAKICSEHFLESDYNREGFSTGVLLEKRTLNRNAIPTIFPEGIIGVKKSVCITKHLRMSTNKIQNILSSYQDTKKTVHEGVSCDFCKKSVEGYRYKCIQCPDLDLCAQCEKDKMHPEHVVLRLPRPLPYKLVQDIIAPLAKVFLSKKSYENRKRTIEVAQASNDQFKLYGNTVPTKTTTTSTTDTSNERQKYKTMQKTEQNGNESDNYSIEVLEDSLDSVDWEPAIPLESPAQPTLKIKSMEIFTVGPDFTLPEENDNDTQTKIPLRSYSGKAKNNEIHSSKNAEKDTDNSEQVQNNASCDNQHDDFYEFNTVDVNLDNLGDDLFEEVKFLEFESE